MKVFKLLVVGLVVLSLNSFAGTTDQKQMLKEKMSGYTSQIFSTKYFDKNTGVFNEKIVNSVFENGYDASDDRNIANLVNHFYNSLGEDLPLYISDDNALFLKKQLELIEEKYPIQTKLKLEKIMYQNNWQFLGLFGSTKLIISSAMTGPKVGLDIVSGGFSKLAKLALNTGEIAKSVKVIKFADFTKIGKIPKQTANGISAVFEGMSKILTKNQKYFTKNMKISSASQKMIDLLESKAFKVFLFIANSKLDTVSTINSLTSDDKDVILQYIEDNKDDTSDTLMQFFTSFILDQVELAADVLDKTKLAIFVKLFQTGVINIMQGSLDGISSDTLETLGKNAWNIGKVAAEFLPVAGPFIELTNTNIAAIADADSSRDKAKSAFRNFVEMSNNETYLALTVYKLSVIEDVIDKINNNDKYVDSTGNYFDPNIMVKGNASSYKFLQKAITQQGFAIEDFILSEKIFRQNNKVSSSQAEMLARKTYKKVNNNENSSINVNYFFKSFKNITRNDFANLMVHYGLIDPGIIGAVNKIKKLGISTSDNFRGDDEITIYEFLVMIVRVLEVNQNIDINNFANKG
jgi:hypothetical protein